MEVKAHGKNGYKRSKIFEKLQSREFSIKILIKNFF